MLTIQFSKYLNYNYFIINRKYVSDTLEHSKALWKDNDYEEGNSKNTYVYSVGINITRSMLYK